MVLKRTPLFWKILVIAAAVSILPLGIAMYLSLETATGVAEELVRKNLMQHAKQVSQRIGYTIVSMDSDLEVLASLPVTAEAYLPFTLSQRRELYSIQEHVRRMEPVPKYREVAYYDRYGNASVLVRDDLEIADAGKFVPLDNRWCEKTDFVAEALARPGELIYSGLIGCPFSVSKYTPAGGRLSDRFDGGIRVSSAALDRQGRPVGVVTLVLSQLHLVWALESIEDESPVRDLWGMMVDREGWILAGPYPCFTRALDRSGKLVAATDWKSHSPLNMARLPAPAGATYGTLVDEANVGNEASDVVEQEGYPARVVASHPIKAQFGPFTEKKPLGTIFVFYPREKAVAVADMLRRNFGLLLGITIVLLLVGTALLARHISRPIRELATAAKSIAAGKTTPVKADRSDEIGDLGRAFDQMQQDLEVHREALIRNERLAAVGRFVSGIVHETKNVLGALGNYLKVLERKVDDDSKNRIIDPMRRALEQLDTLARRMRELSLTPRFSQTDLVHVLKYTVQLAEPQSNEQGISVETDLPDQLELPRGDASLLGQVLLNVLLNALEATGKGGTVRLAMTASPDEVVVMCHDSGPGFPHGPTAEFLEPFYTTKAGGTGLGLYISGTIVQRHDGELLLYNHEDGGAVVEIRLPLTKESVK